MTDSSNGSGNGPTSELDDQIASALRRAFAPGPALGATTARITAIARTGTGTDTVTGTDTGTDMATSRPDRRPWRAAAAAVLMLSLGLLVFWLVRDRAARTERAHAATQVANVWHSTFEDAVQSGYPSPGCCLPVVDLADHCVRRFACALRIEPATGLELIGFYCGSFCSKTSDEPAVLLLRAVGEPVCVFVATLARDPRPDLVALEGRRLVVRRREVAPLVLYEVSRSPARSVLEHFTVAQ